MAAGGADHGKGHFIGLAGTDCAWGRGGSIAPGDGGTLRGRAFDSGADRGSVSCRRALRQAWELDDADKAGQLLRNLARRLDQQAVGVAASLLEGLDEMLTVNRLGLPAPLRRSLACANSIENMMGAVRRVSRNVKRWRNSAMALRWTAAGMMDAAKGFRRLKAYRYLPVLKPRASLFLRKLAQENVGLFVHWQLFGTTTFT